MYKDKKKTEENSKREREREKKILKEKFDFVFH